MNSNADENQGLHIPENLLQEATTASHVTGTPRSTGLFDYISRAANSAATILQTRPFSARATRRKVVNGSPALVIAPAIDSIEGRKPPDLQDRSNSKYPQVVQPQNSVEACVFDDGGADSALEGASVDIGRIQEAPRAAKAVTFQDGSPDAVLGEPSAARRRNAFDDDRPEEITFNPRSKPASAATPKDASGPFEFSAVAQTTQNPYSKLVELCNQRGRRGRRGATNNNSVRPQTAMLGSSAAAPAIAKYNLVSSHRNPFSTESGIGRAESNINGQNNRLDGNTSLVRFEPTADPVALARSLPPSAANAYQPASGTGAVELAPQSSMHFAAASTINGSMNPSGFPAAALPVSKRLSHAPPPASRYALFGPASTKPSAAAPSTSAAAAANALVAAPVNRNTHMQPSAAAAGWKLPKKDTGNLTDMASTWVPSRARMLARRRAARVRFKPSLGADRPAINDGSSSGAASQELVVHSGTKRSRVLSPGEITAVHERSAARRRIDSSVSVARRSLRAGDQPQITASEVLAAADAIAQRKVAAQSQVPALDLSRALLSSQQPAGMSSDVHTDSESQQPRLGASLTFPDAFAPPLTPSAALIAEEARREKARRARQRDSGPSSVSPPAKRHAPGGSPLDSPSLGHTTPAMLGDSSAAALGGATDPPTNLDDGILFPSAQPVSALVGGALQTQSTGQGARVQSNVGSVLDLLERRKQEMARGEAPSMSVAEVKERLSAQEAAKQAAEERRGQAARGAEPENPQFKAPASESQAPSWPAWENAVKEREAAGLPKFTNISQVMKALPKSNTDDALPSGNTSSAAVPGGFTPLAPGPRPHVPPLFGPGSISAAQSSTPSFSVPAASSAPAAATGGAQDAGAKSAAAAEGASEAPKKKKPVVSGWGDAFLKANAAESAATQKAIQEEVDKANAPASFGSPVPAATSKGSISFGGPAPSFGTKDPPPMQPSSLFPAGDKSTASASEPAASSSSLTFSFGAPPASQPAPASSSGPASTADASAPAPLFGQQPPSSTDGAAAPSSKRRARDEDDEPSAKRSAPFSVGMDAGTKPSALFGDAGASATAAVPSASSAPLFGGMSSSAASGAAAAPFGGSAAASLFGQSSAAPSSDTGAAAAASQPLFGGPASAAVSASAPASAPLFGAPTISTGAPAASPSTGLSFTFGAASGGAASSAAAAAPVFTGGSSAPMFGGSGGVDPGGAKGFKPIVFTPPGSTSAPEATGGEAAALQTQIQGGDLTTPRMPGDSQTEAAAAGATASGSGMFGSGTTGAAGGLTNAASASQSSAAFGGTSFGASGFGGAPSGFGTITSSSAAPSFGTAAPAATPSGLFGASSAAAASGAVASGLGAPGSTPGANPLFGGPSATPNGFASAPAASPMGFGATPSAAASSSAAIPALGATTPGSTLFGGTSVPAFGATTSNNPPPATNMFAASSAATNMFGASSGGMVFAAGAGASAAAPSPGGFSFGAGFGAPASAAASQSALGAGSGTANLFGAPSPAGSSGHGANPFGNPAAASFGNSSAGPFQFGAASPFPGAAPVNPTPTASPMMGAPGNNGLFGNNAASAAAPSGFGAPAAASPSPFGAPGSAPAFGAPAPSAGAPTFGAAGASGFGAAPAQAPTSPFGGAPAPFGGAGAAPFGGAQPQAQPQGQPGAPQMGTMFGGNTQAFNMGSSQPQQRKSRVVVRRRAGGRSGR